MGKWFRGFAAFVCALALLFSFDVTPAQAASEVSVQIDGEFLYDVAKSMLPLINEFRTGDDAWYLDQSNNKVRPGGIKKLISPDARPCQTVGHYFHHVYSFSFLRKSATRSISSSVA